MKILSSRGGMEPRPPVQKPNVLPLGHGTLSWNTLLHLFILHVTYQYLRQNFQTYIFTNLNISYLH